MNFDFRLRTRRRRGYGGRARRGTTKFATKVGTKVATKVATKWETKWETKWGSRRSGLAGRIG